jgi:hypothetical protein
MTDRYTKLLLTAIALELLWLGVWREARPLNAQQKVMPVVITGVHLEPTSVGALPVVVNGTVDITAPVALKIQADEPLLVKAVPYTPSTRPGD